MGKKLEEFVMSFPGMKTKDWFRNQRKEFGGERNERTYLDCVLPVYDVLLSASIYAITDVSSDMVGYLSINGLN
jgi:hypothetical protein